MKRKEKENVRASEYQSEFLYFVKEGNRLLKGRIIFYNVRRKRTYKTVCDFVTCRHSNQSSALSVHLSRTVSGTLIHLHLNDYRSFFFTYLLSVRRNIFLLFLFCFLILIPLFLSPLILFTFLFPFLPTLPINPARGSLRMELSDLDPHLIHVTDLELYQNSRYETA